VESELAEGERPIKATKNLSRLGQVQDDTLGYFGAGSSVDASVFFSRQLGVHMTFVRRFAVGIEDGLFKHICSGRRCTEEVAGDI
jgi:hypothetical protein